jgi:hypothetical protein
MKRVAIEEAEGRTLTGFAFSGIVEQIVFVFGDCYCCLGIPDGRYDETPSIFEQELDVLNFGNERLIKAGFPAENLKSLLTEKKAVLSIEREKRERAQYEYLRKKFEPTQ